MERFNPRHYYSYDSLPPAAQLYFWPSRNGSFVQLSIVSYEGECHRRARQKNDQALLMKDRLRGWKRYFGKTTLSPQESTSGEDIMHVDACEIDKKYDEIKMRWAMAANPAVTLREFSTPTDYHFVLSCKVPGSQIVVERHEPLKRVLPSSRIRIETKGYINGNPMTDHDARQLWDYYGDYLRRPDKYQRFIDDLTGISVSERLYRTIQAEIVDENRRIFGQNRTVTHSTTTPTP